MNCRYTNRLRQTVTVQASGTAAWTVAYCYGAARRLTNVISQADAFEEKGP